MSRPSRTAPSARTLRRLGAVGVLAILLAAPAGAQSATPTGPPNLDPAVATTPDAAEAAVPDAAPAPLSIASITACNNDARAKAKAYVAKDSTAIVYALDVFANVLHSHGSRLTEGDSVVVFVGAPPDVMERLRVRLESAPRATTLAPVSSGPATPPGFVPDAELPPCAVREFRFRDVAAGLVDIRVETMGVDAKNQPVAGEVGKLGLAADGLFGGVLTFGPVASGLQSRTYSLVPEDPASDSSATVVSLDEGPQVRFMVGVSLFAPRVLSSADGAIKGAFTLGFDLEKPLENGYAGVTGSYRDALWVTAGAHVGRVQRLPSELSALAPGSVYAGATLPTVERYRVAPFVSVGVGLTTALKATGDALGKLLKR